MRASLFAAALIAGAVATSTGSAEARSHSYRHHYVIGEADLVSHRHYTNASGHWVHSPSKTLNGRAPVGWTAQCSDGSYSFSEHHRGTCSHHGGVSAWH